MERYSNGLFTQLTSLSFPPFFDLTQDIDIEENLIKLFDTPWHQDLAYWPNTNITTDTRTLTFYFNLGNYSTPSYDKIYYIPNSGRIKKLRNHSYIPDNEPNSCTLHTSINLQNERVKFLEVSLHF